MVTGVTKSIRYDILDKMSKLLEVPISELLEQVDDEPEK